MSGLCHDEPKVRDTPDVGCDTSKDAHLDGTGGGPGNSARLAMLTGAADPVDEEVGRIVDDLQRLSEPPLEFVSSARQLVQNASPEVRKRLWEERAFLEETCWKDQPRTLSGLFEELDPVNHLAMALLRSAYVSGPAGRLDVLETWCQQHPDSCSRALGNSDVSLALNSLGEADHLKAVHLLMFQGELPDEARPELGRALVEGDDELFLKSWHVVAEDPAALARLQQDAEFLGRVRERLLPTTFALVEATIFRSEESTSEELDQRLRPIVDATLRGLDELDNTFLVRDADVVTTL